jgi:hypothetical protein
MRLCHIQRMHALTQLNYEARLNVVTIMCERHQGNDQWLKRRMFILMEWLDNVIEYFKIINKLE